MTNVSKFCWTVLLLSFVMNGAQSSAQSNPSSSSRRTLDRVRALPPVVKDLNLNTVQPCRIDAYEQTPLFSKATGYVQEVLVDLGDVVKKDQLLVKLFIPEMDDELTQKQAMLEQASAEVKQSEASLQGAKALVETARAKVAQAEAGVGRAQGELARWQAELQRYEQLAASGAVNQKLVEETRNQFQAAQASRLEADANILSAHATTNEAQANLSRFEADIVAAQARLKVAQSNLSKAQTMMNYREIRAPYDAVLTSRHIDTGHFVQPASGVSAQPLLEVMSTSRVRARVSIPEVEAPLVDAGERGDAATISVQALAPRTFEGKVTRTSWSLDPANRSLTIEIDLPNSEGILRPGMYATATVRLDQRQGVLTVPATAIVREAARTLVRVVVSGQVQDRDITLGLRSGPDIEVTSGLSASDLVIQTQPGQYQPGQAVEVIP